MASVNKTASVTFPPTLVKPIERNAMPVGGNPDICGRLWGHLTIIGENKMSNISLFNALYPNNLSRIAKLAKDDWYRKTFLDFDFVFQNLTNELSDIFDHWDTYNEVNKAVSVNHPVNIFKNNNVTTIEIALAGFSKEDISINEEDDGKYRTLTISGKQNKEDKNESVEYVSSQISKRDFKKTFSLTKDSKVESASYKDGILTIKISEPEKVKPEVTTKSVSIKID